MSFRVSHGKCIKITRIGSGGFMKWECLNVLLWNTLFQRAGYTYVPDTCPIKKKKDIREKRDRGGKVIYRALFTPRERVSSSGLFSERVQACALCGRTMIFKVSESDRKVFVDRKFCTYTQTFTEYGYVCLLQCYPIRKSFCFIRTLRK